MAAIAPPPRQTGPVLSGGRPHQRRSPRDPGGPGNGVSATLAAAQLTPVGRLHLHLAHAAGLDPTHSGRVTMDSLMKLVTTALEWTYEAGETDVQTGTLEQAAQLLVLRRDTLQIIDGTGPRGDVARPDGAASGSAYGTEQPEETIRAHGPQNTTNAVEAQVPPHKSPKCTFAGVVAIDLTRFADSGVALVECPACARMRSLSPHKGVLRFPSHDRRKLQT